MVRLSRPGPAARAGFAESARRLRSPAFQLVELKSGETYNGILVSCDTWMNLHLREVICTSKARYAALRNAAPETLAPATSRPAHAARARPERRTATASGACRCATCAATPSSTCACRRRCVKRKRGAQGCACSVQLLRCADLAAFSAVSQVLEKVAEEKVKRSDTRPGGGGRGRGGRDGGGYGRGDGEGRGRGGGYGGRGDGGRGRGEGRGGGGRGRGSGRGEAAPEWA